MPLVSVSLSALSGRLCAGLGSRVGGSSLRSDAVPRRLALDGGHDAKGGDEERERQ